MSASVIPFRRDDAPDALFDTSDQAMALKIGARAIAEARAGNDSTWWWARLAASYADRVLMSQSLTDALDRELSSLGFVVVSSSRLVH